MSSGALKDSKLSSNRGGASERNISGSRLPDDKDVPSTAHNTIPVNPDSTIQQPESISVSGANVRGGHASLETREPVDLATGVNVIPEEPSLAADTVPPLKSRGSSERHSQSKHQSDKLSGGGSRRSGAHLEEATRGLINDTRNSDLRTNSQQMAYDSVASGSNGNNRMKVNINN